MKSSHYHTTLLVLSSLLLSNIALAQSDIFDRFAGIYSIKNGPNQSQFILFPTANELHGNIVYSGRDYPLTATVDGLILKATFGIDKKHYNFRMPLSTKSLFQVTFEGDDFGAWTFARSPLPSFAGQFSGDFGTITLTPSSSGQLSGQYRHSNNQTVKPIDAVQHGLSAELVGLQGGQLLYSLEEKRYFVQSDKHFAIAHHKTLKTLEQERQALIEQDNIAWRQAVALQSIFALNSYVDAWPNGVHIDEVMSVRDDLVWQSAIANNQLEDYLSYADAFPKGKYISKVDDNSWTLVLNIDSVTAYNDYLKYFPTGRHVNKAHNNIDELGWRVATELGNITGYRDYVAQFPNGLHAKAADDSAWEIARSKHTQGAYDGYLSHFKNGLHIAKVAKAKANAKLARQDDQAFALARQNDTVANYRAYLKAFPRGRHIGVAQQQIDKELSAQLAQKDDIAWQQALAADSMVRIKQYAQAWPKGRHSAEVSKALRLMAQKKIDLQDDVDFADVQRKGDLSSYQMYLVKYQEARHKSTALAAISKIKQAQEAQTAFIRKIQSNLRLLGYTGNSPSGILNSTTSSLIRAFERDIQQPQIGQASTLLLHQLSSAVNFEKKLKSAKAGSAEHMITVGDHLATGTGVIVNQAKAVAWYQKAAQNGHPIGMSKLGYGYLTGQGIAKDEKTGLKWIRKAVRLGNSEGMYQLALLYLQGIEVRQHHKKGIGWLVKSAQRGRTQSLDFLGDLYLNGKYGTGVSSKEAVNWYQKGAVAGIVSSMLNLAQMYEYGNGVAQNREQAIKWYHKAAAKNDTTAKQWLKSNSS